MSWRRLRRMKNTTPLLCYPRFFALYLILVFGIFECVHADTQVGRYITVSDAPTAEQRDLLRVTIQINFPVEVETVGAALRTLLSTQGLRLGITQSDDHRLILDRLMKQRLPDVHRTLGPMSLKDALETLAGPSWLLVYDPLNRLVSFEICQQKGVRK